MSGVNKVILVGNLGADPELKTTSGSQQVAQLRVAVNESWTDKAGARQERTEWVRVVAWGKLADLCSQFLAKGRQVYVEGRLQTREWTDKENRKQFTTEVVANHDTTILGPNTVARIRMRFRTWPGPFVFHCHNLEHEDMRMMFNFEVVPGPDHDPNVAPAARTHGNALTLDGRSAARPDGRIGELDWEQAPVPPTPVREAGEPLIPPRTPDTARP